MGTRSSSRADEDMENDGGKGWSESRGKGSEMAIPTISQTVNAVEELLMTTKMSSGELEFWLMVFVQKLQRICLDFIRGIVIV